ncbi:hypothetical protein ABEB36_015254 [Hypothenemus hampei]|uniref:Uncharacterized protein n=1 Tax=Hypothenemus hampei TaxID=57062 RepID=A0ABD1E1U7_HYPHA
MPYFVTILTDWSAVPTTCVGNVSIVSSSSGPGGVLAVCNLGCFCGLSVMGDDKAIEELTEKLRNFNASLSVGTASGFAIMPNENRDGNNINWNLFKSKDDELNKHIFECIQEKLVGKAEILVGNRPEFTAWPLLKAALIQCFSDKRDIDCLIHELTRTRPFKGETLVNFGARLQLLRSNVAQRVSGDNSLSAEQKLCHISFHDKTALNTFIAGCTGTLKNNLHLKQPKSLEDAMGYVMDVWVT